MMSDLISTVRQMMDQTDLPQEIFIDAIRDALLHAAKRRYGSTDDVTIELDQDSGQIRCFVPKKVVEIMRSYAKEIPIEEAKKINPNAELDQIVQVEVSPREFGRIEARIARQILMQKIKDAERDRTFADYKDRIGDVITGYVQRIERSYILLDLDRAEGVLSKGEYDYQADYRRGDPLKCLVVDVDLGARGAQVLLSRTRPELVAKLFEVEVPEIQEGLIEIKSIARDVGDCSKVAVYTSDPSLDPVGTCVGVRGSRVRAVIEELDGEKIELIRWNEKRETFITNALKPAKVTRVSIDDSAEKSATVIVPDDQLSPAIGKRGQNVRLAVRLTGWMIDLKSESEASDLAKMDISDVFKTQKPKAPEKIKEVSEDDGFDAFDDWEISSDLDIALLGSADPETVKKLKSAGYNTNGDLAGATLEDLLVIDGIDKTNVEEMHKSAVASLTSDG